MRKLLFYINIINFFSLHFLLSSSSILFFQPLHFATLSSSSFFEIFPYANFPEFWACTFSCGPLLDNFKPVTFPRTFFLWIWAGHFSAWLFFFDFGSARFHADRFWPLFAMNQTQPRWFWRHCLHNIQFAIKLEKLMPLRSEAGGMGFFRQHGASLQGDRLRAYQFTVLQHKLQGLRCIVWLAVLTASCSALHRYQQLSLTYRLHCIENIN